MKAGNVVKATEEYKRLDWLVKECDGVLADFEKTVDDESIVTGNTIRLEYVVHYGLQPKPKTKTLPISLGCELTALVRDGVKQLIEKKREELIEQRDAIEV